MFESHFEFEAIGTKWLLDFTAPTPKESDHLFYLIRSRVEKFEETYSRFRASSFVSTVAKSAGTYTLPSDAKEMFDLYFDLYTVTGGLFTPLMGQTLEDTGYDASYSLKPKATVSSPPKFDDVLEYSFPNLVVKEKVKLDFGACGKGYIIDIVGEIFKLNSISDFCIDAGGDMLYSSKLSKPLRIGLEDPSNSTQAIGVCEIVSGSLCGSSGNRRNWGKYNHILNPKTVSSPENILASWVWSEKAILSDALATCLFFVEPKVLVKKYNFEYVILNSDYTVERSGNFPGELFKV